MFTRVCIHTYIPIHIYIKPGMHACIYIFLSMSWENMMKRSFSNSSQMMLCDNTFPQEQYAGPFRSATPILLTLP